MSTQLPAHPESSPPSPSEALSWGSPFAEPEPPKQAAQLQRLLSALLRHKWLLLGATLAGTVAGIFASRFVEPRYEAQSTLWIEVEGEQSERQGPIRTGELLQSESWIELLKSYVVLDHVVSEERLYIETASQNDRGAFDSFQLQAHFRPGRYRLEVASSGGTFVLSGDGIEVQRGRVGEPVGERVGFTWRPGERVLRPGRVLQFTVAHPRDASVRLASELNAGIKGEGNFLRLTLAGTDPEQLSATLNTLTARYVSVAADLKRAKLDQLTAVLDEQRRYSEDNLRDAEMGLEGFRVATVTLPSDRASPVAPGLQSTQDPVMSRFFEMKIEREQLRADREAIERILAQSKSSGLSLDALNMVPSTEKAPALESAIQERMSKRAEMRALLQRYTQDHPSVQKLGESLRVLEEQTIPRLANELRMQLLNRESELGSRVASASAELQQIPARAIEEARLKRRVAIAENLHGTLKQRYEEARLAAASTIPDIRVLDPAVTPTEPVQDVRTMVILMGLMGGLGLAVLGVVAADRFDPRVRYPEEITQGMGLAVLGVVPNVKQVTGHGARDATAHAAESFREIRLNLMHAHGAAGPLMLTVTSPGSGDGKSFITSNLALAFADQGYRTLVVDGDTRRGSLHNTLGVRRVPGLTDYLAGNATQDEVLQSTQYPNVYLIGAGTRMSNGPELLGSTAMSQLLVSLRPHFGAILLDSPPLGAGIDAFALGTLTRNLLLVLRTGATDRALATAKLGMLDRLPVRLLGAILNGTPPNSGLYRYYSYLSGYDVPEDEPHASLPPHALAATDAL
jgi:capsular exopolysaccharide synthesis family protein